MIASESITRIRRYLRDPDGDIWSDADLITYFNDAAVEIATKTGLVLRVDAGFYPPQVEFTYFHLWEKDETEGTGYQSLQANQLNQAGGQTICYPWEAWWELDTAPTADDAYRITLPWEIGYVDASDAVPIVLSQQLTDIKLLAYDESPLTPITEKEIAGLDGWYRTTQGDPKYYYHVSQYHNQVVPYPRPSVVWQETDYTTVLDDTGGLVIYDDYWLDATATGITYDVVSLEDAFLCVYEAYPEEVSVITDEIDTRLAPYLIKYIEAGTLERAFGTDTDGFIPSLRDYWQMRKKVGIEAISRWKRLGLIGRDFRIGGAMQKPYRTPWPKLPSDQYCDIY